MDLPESVLAKQQEKTIIRIRCNTKLVIQLRYDDRCGNGHNTFAVTADEYEKNLSRRWRWTAGGQMHERIVQFAPELQKYLKWHLTSSDGPMHYLSNTIYHANNRDCWGGQKGEVRAYRYDVRVNGGLVFDVSGDKAYQLPERKEAEAMAERIKGEVVPVPWLMHEGKERELDTARKCAVWFDATDEELTSPDLKQRLLDRLPGLMEEFKADMEELGFEY